MNLYSKSLLTGDDESKNEEKIKPRHMIVFQPSSQGTYVLQRLLGLKIAVIFVNTDAMCLAFEVVFDEFR